MKVIVMKNTMKRLLTTLVIFALVFTCIPAFSGTLEADAAAKPSPVNSINLKAYGMHEITVSWGKAKKNYNGYTIYRDGKVLKHVGKSVKSYKDLGLKPDTKYSYYVRAYRNVKQKQWFNKKTGKWQTKKPAKKTRGKSRKVTVKLHGRSSPKQSNRTGKPSENCSESTQTHYQGPGLQFEYNASVITVTITNLNECESDSRVTLTHENLPTITLDKTKPTHQFEGLEMNTKYSFDVVYYYGGKERQRGTSLVKTGRVYNFHSKYDYSSIKLEWKQFEGDKTYKLTKKCGDTVIFKDKVIASPEYTDTEVEKGKIYNYFLEIVDEDNNVITLATRGTLLQK